MDYPKHLYEKIREEVALSYLRHELRKLFPSIDDGEIFRLMNNPHLAKPRDFWNGIHGVGMGFKLHIGFIYLLTAENITWSKETVETDQLWFGVERPDTKMVREGKISARELMEYFENHIEETKEHKNDFDDSGREADPVIAVEKEVDGIKVLGIYEGNGRLYKAVLDKKERLEAYVGRYSTPELKPMNYWLPTSIIMDNILFVYQAIREKNEDIFEAQIKNLKYILRDSEAGRFELENRALTSDPTVREKILGAIGIPILSE